MTDYDLPNRYEIIREIASGGTGIVLKARDSNLNKVVAIKVLMSNLLEKESKYITRFQAEAKAAGKLRHEGLVMIIDFGVTKSNHPYIVMEFNEGKTLKDRINQEGRLSLQETLSITKQIARAMQYSHSKGIIHRDLKPANILIADDQPSTTTVKVIDFGIAKTLTDKSEKQMLTQSGELLGTPKYMSPEHIHGNEISASSDIYSLGCIMFECLTGSVPFQGDTAFDTMEMHLKTRAPSLNDFDGVKIETHLLEEVSACLNKMLAKKAEDRFQSMTDLLREVESLYDQSSSTDEQLITEENSFSKKENIYSGDKEFSQMKKSFFLSRTSFAIVAMIGCILSFLYFRLTEVDKITPPNESPKEPLLKRGILEAVPPHILNKLITDAEAKYGILDIEGVVIDDRMLKRIAKSNLKSVEIKTSEFKLSDSLKLPKNSTVRFIDFTQTEYFKDDYIKHLKSFKKLEKIELSHTGITDKGVLKLSKMKNLNNIELDNTDVHDSSIIALINNLKLVELQISKTKITERTLKALESETTLTELHIMNCDVSPEAIENLKRALPGCHIREY